MSLDYNMEDGSLVIPMALAYLIHFIRSRLRDKHRNPSVGIWNKVLTTAKLLTMEKYTKNSSATYVTIHMHYNDVIMGAMASQITSLMIVYSSIYSGAGQRTHQSSGSRAFVGGMHRWPVNSTHKWPVTRKTFPFGVIMNDEFGLEHGAWEFSHSYGTGTSPPSYSMQVEW